MLVDIFDGPDGSSAVTDLVVDPTVEAFKAYLDAFRAHKDSCRTLHDATVNLLSQLAKADCLATLRRDLS